MYKIKDKIIYIYIYIYIYIADWVIRKTQKLRLDASLLNTGTDQGKSGAIQGKEEHPSFHLGVVAIEKGAFGSPLTTIATFTYFIIFLGVYFSQYWYHFYIFSEDTIPRINSTNLHCSFERLEVHLNQVENWITQKIILKISLLLCCF